MIYIHITHCSAGVIHTSCQVSLKSVHRFWRRFLKVFTIYGHVGHLGHVTWIIYIHIGSPFLQMLHIRLKHNQGGHLGFTFFFFQKMNFKWGIFRWHFSYQRLYVGAKTQKFLFSFQAFKNYTIPMPLGPTYLKI